MGRRKVRKTQAQSKRELPSPLFCRPAQVLFSSSQRISTFYARLFLEKGWYFSERFRLLTETIVLWSMRPIRLREPSSPTMAKAEIFEGGVYGVIRRAVVIGNGSPCAENQCIGLVQALGLADKHVLYVSSANSPILRVELFSSGIH